MVTRIRFSHETAERGMVILETEPVSRSLATYSTIVRRRRLYDEDDDGQLRRMSQSQEGVVYIRLFFPYLLHIVHYKLRNNRYHYGGIAERGLMVFLANKPLSSLDDMIYFSPTDRERAGLVCTPHEYDNLAYMSRNALLTDVMGMWWNAVHAFRGTEITAWQKCSSVEEALAMHWGEEFTLRSALMKDYMKFYNYGWAPMPLPDTAEMILEALPQPTVTL